LGGGEESEAHSEAHSSATLATDAKAIDMLNIWNRFIVMQVLFREENPPERPPSKLDPMKNDVVYEGEVEGRWNDAEKSDNGLSFYQDRQNPISNEWKPPKIAPQVTSAPWKSLT